MARTAAHAITFRNGARIRKHRYTTKAVAPRKIVHLSARWVGVDGGGRTSGMRLGRRGRVSRAACDRWKRRRCYLPRAGGGGSVPPSASVFMFCRNRVNVATRPALFFSRDASSGIIELSYISV